ncbi:MAG TPA: hypothetical protein VGE59_04820 [Patescibacteria group bacterium]
MPSWVFGVGAVALLLGLVCICMSQRALRIFGQGVLVIAAYWMAVIFITELPLILLDLIVTGVKMAGTAGIDWLKGFVGIKPQGVNAAELVFVFLKPSLVLFLLARAGLRFAQIIESAIVEDQTVLQTLRESRHIRWY